MLAVRTPAARMTVRRGPPTCGRNDTNASPSRLVAMAEEDRLSTTIWSGGAAAGLYLALFLAFLVQTHYPGTLGLREWIRVVLSWPLIFFLRSK
jgi:hypothetical protein